MVKEGIGLIWPDIQRNLGEVFDEGVLPTMVYINKQRSNRGRVDRPLHSHESICEMLLIYRGTGVYTVNAVTYCLEEGDVLFYNQGNLHEVSSGTQEEIGSYCVGITNLRLKGLGRNHLVGEDGPYVRKAGQMYPLLREMCEQMYQIQETNHTGRLAAQLLCAALVVMASQLEAFPQAVADGAKEEQFVARIWSYLNKHYTEDVSLEKIAETLGCSAPYVSHAFKKATGSTPIQYVIRRRIGLAQTLLISTDMTATQIAVTVGYDNTNYFCTLFAKVVGMTPIRYRGLYLEELKGIRNQS